MKVTYPTTATAEVVAIRCTVPFDADDEIPEDFPGRDGNEIVLTLSLDTGKVRDWPAGRTAKLCLKVRDQGVYELFGSDESVIATQEDYVPHCLPQSYGDYFEPEIAGDGTVTNWRTDARSPEKVSAAFWPREER